ncbi:hypothetical protein [Bradyrhizobium sp. 164]|uniref:hypothetical protein n=1 Tax=Bradyrhizobium sp. 164 TaxID=2782637 RepID=UPI001FFC0714|nr:hypothetical protein [Bradyrhizobium sp. 164]MCK1595484.1 hypothetical protein [Bradyrhizobium sp. 164]
MTLSIKHASLTGAAANPKVLVDGPKWDADHTVTGNLPVSQLNGGSGASSSTFWRGDGSWAPVREVLTAARTYYVRTDGSDSNNGLTNTAGGAFLTIQKAIDATSALDMGTYQVTIQVANGTYAGASTLRSYLGTLQPIIVGNEATPTNVVVNPTSATCFQSDGTDPWKIRGMQLKTTTSGGCLDAINGGAIYFRNVDFGAAPTFHCRAYLNGNIASEGNFSISGGSDFCMLAIASGVVSLNSTTTITVTGTPAWGTACAYASMTGVIYSSGPVWSGAATGTRYTAALNAVINTGGGGASYFPGNAAGSTATGGQYA